MLYRLHMLLYFGGHVVDIPISRPLQNIALIQNQTKNNLLKA